MKCEKNTESSGKIAESHKKIEKNAESVVFVFLSLRESALADSWQSKIKSCVFRAKFCDSQNLARFPSLRDSAKQNRGNPLERLCILDESLTCNESVLICFWDIDSIF
ncbi:hypothetical protein [Helicobacter sp. 23-1045]